MPPSLPGPPAPIPAFVNPEAGSAAAALEALARDARFEVRETPADALADALRSAVRDAVPRVLVCGGDGTIASAATVLAGTPVELAILPGGTLNHFARDHGIPTEPGAALDFAASAPARGIDAADVDGRLFLNTSSVGAYVAFVRARERLEPYFGYRISSFLASIRIFAGLRSFDVFIDADGRESSHHTPLVFVGVGERQLRLPGFGRRKREGRRGLHVVVVRGRTRARVLALALAAAARGFRTSTKTPSLESFLVDRFRVELRRPLARVAVDGEITRAVAPLEFRLLRDHIRVVAGSPGDDADAAREGDDG